MNDVEHDLRELLDRKASSVGTVAPKLPEHVRKRSRRRELGTVLVSGITVVALVIGSLAAVRALSEGTDRTPTPAEDPWAGYDVFERTATIETLTITSPSDWYLVNQWPMGARAVQDSNNGVCSVTVSPDGGEQVENCSETADGRGRERSFPMVPILMLSNADLGLGPSACLDGGLGLRGDAAVLEIAVDTRTVDLIEAGSDPDLPGLPVAFDPNNVADGPCGEGHYARFQVGRYPYVAWAGFGPDTSPEVREALFEIAGTLEVDDEAFVQGTLQKTPGYVIAGGENAAGPWRLELRRSTGDGPSANVELSVISPEGEIGAGDFSVPDDAPIEQAGGDPTFGAVTKEASGVELRLEEGTPPIPAQVVPLPPGMPFDFDLFFASYDGDVPARAVPIGLESTGQSETTESPDAAPEASAEGDLVTLSGADRDLGVRWTMKLSGSVEEPCIDLDTRIDFDPWCPSSLSSPQPILSIWADQGRFLLAGSAPARFDDVRFVGESWQSEGKCVEGPTGWDGRRGCVLPLLGLEDGTIIFSGDQGELSWTLDREARILPENKVPGATQATGEFLGFPWSVETGFYEEGIDVNVDGAERSIERPNLDEPVALPFPRSEFQALLIILTDLSVDQVSVASEGRWYGRWMHSATRDGDEARLWIVELPGAGSGALSYDGKRVASVSWP